MLTEKKKSVKKWTTPRHQVVRYVLYPLIVFLVWVLYGFKVTKFKEENNRQYLILSNHQTGFDQFYPSAAFRRPIYYVASEDIFSMGFLSQIIIWNIFYVYFNRIRYKEIPVYLFLNDVPV